MLCLVTGGCRLWPWKAPKHVLLFKLVAPLKLWRLNRNCVYVLLAVAHLTYAVTNGNVSWNVGSIFFYYSRNCSRKQMDLQKISIWISLLIWVWTSWSVWESFAYVTYLALNNTALRMFLNRNQYCLIPYKMNIHMRRGENEERKQRGEKMNF